MDNIISHRQGLYKTARLVGTNRAFVGLIHMNFNETMYLCVMPYGPNRWIMLSELTDYCL